MINHINDYPEDMTGMKVVVVGGGAVGLDVVEFFSKQFVKSDIILNVYFSLFYLYTDIQ